MRSRYRDVDPPAARTAGASLREPTAAPEVCADGRTSQTVSDVTYRDGERRVRRRAELRSSRLSVPPFREACDRNRLRTRALRMTEQRRPLGTLARDVKVVCLVFG